MRWPSGYATATRRNGDRDMAEPVTEPRSKREQEPKDAVLAARAGSVAAQAPAVRGVESGEEPARRKAIFRLEDVTASYSGVPAVRDISFEIAQNEITALIGPSGCG